MSAPELFVLIGGVLTGRVSRDARGRYRFLYDPEYRSRADAVPLSLSMPLAAAEHEHRLIEAFMWGLLPDNERIVDRWAKRFQVSGRNPFALLSHVGEDCAGAVQFVLSERIDDFLGQGPAQVSWLSERAVAERLEALREDHSSWRVARDTGQFSLAGAQPKTALFFLRGRWGVPKGRTPTTHILKPPVGDLDGHAENEHLCLSLARELGLPAARSEVRTFGDEKAIVVERYDRVRVNNDILRLHQEDLCQALGLLPTLKYQNEGGPSPSMIFELLRVHSSRPDEDVATFVDALILNWMIAGTDGHAKNYSLLLGQRGQVRLAPLYDLGSALPYPDLDQRRLKLAMKIGDTYRVREVSRGDWERLTREAELTKGAVIDRAKELSELVIEAVPRVCEQAKAEGLSHPIVQVLEQSIVRHARSCLKVLSARDGATDPA